jgi:hypothetical protein
MDRLKQIAREHLGVDVFEVEDVHNLFKVQAGVLQRALTAAYQLGVGEHACVAYASIDLWNTRQDRFADAVAWQQAAHSIASEMGLESEVAIVDKQFLDLKIVVPDSLLDQFLRCLRNRGINLQFTCQNAIQVEKCASMGQEAEEE